MSEKTQTAEISFWSRGANSFLDMWTARAQPVSSASRQALSLLNSHEVSGTGVTNSISHRRNQLPRKETSQGHPNLQNPGLQILEALGSPLVGPEETLWTQLPGEPSLPVSTPTVDRPQGCPECTLEPTPHSNSTMSFDSCTQGGVQIHSSHRQHGQIQARHKGPQQLCRHTLRHTTRTAT